MSAVITSPDSERIREALEYVSPEDRATWLDMGMAVKSELGEAGFDLWDQWSKPGTTYNAKDARATWKSFKADGGITIGTLFHEAKAGGWHPKGTYHPPSPQALAERLRVAEQRAKEAEAEIAQERDRAAEWAKEVWGKAKTPSPTHPYLAKKQITATNSIRAIGVAELAGILGYTPKSREVPLTGSVLVVPVKQDDQLSTLELIDEEGNKSALRGGGKGGGYWAAQPLSGELEMLLIGEGVATALSAGEATGQAVVAALSNKNLVKVAEVMREKYPKAQIILLADLVKATGEPDPHAVEAARAVGGKVAVPDFGDDREAEQKDFNDMAVQCRPEAVRRAIEAAEVPPEAVAEAASEGEGYPEPVPLLTLPPVPEFPPDLLPDALADWVLDEAARARFRPDFTAVASMAALGSVIGRKIGIRLKQRDDWTEYGNVWGGMIGPPSALKSPAMRAGLRPFKALQVRADEQHAEAIEGYERELAVFKLRKEAKKKAAMKELANNDGADIDLGDEAPPDEPIKRTYWTSNVNEASLGVLLEQNPNGLLIERDELSSLLVNLENENYADLRGMMLSGWSGSEGYRFDRIMRGTTNLPKFALSVVGGIQPGPLARYVRGAFSGERADGLLQRFQLLVWPDPADFEYVDRYPSGAAKEAAAALFERIDNLDADAVGERDEFGDNPPFIRLSGEAQALFVEWYTAFMTTRRATEAGGGESAPVAAHFGKYPGLVGKLALILHLADDPASGEVSARTMLKALAWIDYLTPHALRVYHAVEYPETGAAELLLSRLRHDELPPRFKAWEVSKKGWRGLTETQTVKKACRLLFEYGWIIEVDPGGDIGAAGGRPTEPTYMVSPTVAVVP